MKKIFLIIAIIQTLFLVGCSEKQNVANNQIENENQFNIEVEDIDAKSGELNELIGVKTLNEDERLELIGADDIENGDLNKAEFKKLKLNSKQLLNINGKKLIFGLDITDYEITDDYYITIQYKIKLTSYDEDGKTIANYYFQSEDNSEGNATIEERKKKIQEYLEVNIGTIKDTQNAESYLVFQMYPRCGGNDLYLYTIDGERLLFCFDNNYGMYPPYILKDSVYTDVGEINYSNYVDVADINYYEDEILIYDMYIDFEINDEKLKYQERVARNETDSTKDNVRHKITIENGKIVDKIIKIYENIPIGQIS